MENVDERTKVRVIRIDVETVVRPDIRLVHVVADKTTKSLPPVKPLGSLPLQIVPMEGCSS